MVSIIVVTTFSGLLALINIGNNAAFNGIISLVLEGFYISYLLAVALLLWRRLRGDMDDPDSPLTVFSSRAQQDESDNRRLTWGPWRLKGSLGVANNIVACSYLVLLIFFSFWPNQFRFSDPAAMNWSVVVTVSVALFSVGYYMIYAKKLYNGPIVEVDPHML